MLVYKHRHPLKEKSGDILYFFFFVFKKQKQKNRKGCEMCWFWSFAITRIVV